MKQTSGVLKVTALAGLAIVGATLVGCSKKHDVTQSAARVDGTEITVHQINFRLQRERVRADQAEAASHKVLEQLIDEQLIVEKAEKDKVDKEPDAQQALAAARRDVLARAYVEQLGQGVAPPSEDTLRRYYADNDALFSHRRIYTLQELLARVPADKQPQLKAIIDAGKPYADVTAWLKAQNAAYREQQGTHPAEEIPLAALKPLAALTDGQGLMTSSGDQVHVTYVASSESQPVSFERAQPAIQQFLTVDARRKTAESTVAALRSAAKIDYAAPYQALAASEPVFTTRDVAASSVPVQPAVGDRVALPANGASAVQVSLPSDVGGSGVRVTLPGTTAPGVRVSLPTSASSVEVRLPPQTGGDAAKK